MSRSVRAVRRWHIVVGIVGMSLALPLEAQFTPRVGLTYATQPNSAPDFTDRIGIVIGGSLNIPFGLISLQPEALYVQKRVTRPGLNGADPSTLRVDYLEIPLLLRVGLPIPGFSPFAVAGPMIDVELGCNLVAGMCPQSVKDQSYGFAVGGGFRLGLVLPLQLEGRYTWGLRDVGDVASGLDQRTRTFMLMVGMGF